MVKVVVLFVTAAPEAAVPKSRSGMVLAWKSHEGCTLIITLNWLVAVAANDAWPAPRSRAAGKSRNDRYFFMVMTLLRNIYIGTNDPVVCPSFCFYACRAPTRLPAGWRYWIHQRRFATAGLMQKSETIVSRGRNFGNHQANLSSQYNRHHSLCYGC